MNRRLNITADFGLRLESEPPSYVDQDDSRLQATWRGLEQGQRILFMASTMELKENFGKEYGLLNVDIENGLRRGQVLCTSNKTVLVDANLCDSSGNSTANDFMPTLMYNLLGSGNFCYTIRGIDP